MRTMTMCTLWIFKFSPTRIKDDYKPNLPVGVIPVHSCSTAKSVFFLFPFYL